MSSTLGNVGQRKWVVSVAVVFLSLLTATALAYARLIPVEIKQIPYYDSIGHFLLFGVLAYTLNRAFSKKLFLGTFGIPLSAVLVICYALVDESLQLFSSVRTFALGDLFLGFMGVVVFTVVGEMRNHKETVG